MKYVIVILVVAFSGWYNYCHETYHNHMDIQMNFDKVDFHKHGIESPEYQPKMVA